MYTYTYIAILYFHCFVLISDQEHWPVVVVAGTRAWIRHGIRSDLALIHRSGVKFKYSHHYAPSIPSAVIVFVFTALRKCLFALEFYCLLNPIHYTQLNVKLVAVVWIRPAICDRICRRVKFIELWVIMLNIIKF